MKNKSDICEYLLAALKREYALQKNDIGADALLKKRGMTFETESYEVAGFGHVFRADEDGNGGSLSL